MRPSIPPEGGGDFGPSPWIPIGAVDPIDYEMVLALVTTGDKGKLVHRIAMYDPETGDWTVFGAKWDAMPVYVMPLPLPPSESNPASEGLPPMALTHHHLANLESSIRREGYTILANPTTGAISLERDGPVPCYVCGRTHECPRFPDDALALTSIAKSL